MNFAVGDRLLVDGEVCDVVGSISYRNIYDNSMWMEYRLISQKTGREKWLSYDEEFREYSVLEVTNSASTAASRSGPGAGRGNGSLGRRGCGNRG